METLKLFFYINPSSYDLIRVSDESAPIKGALEIPFEVDRKGDLNLNIIRTLRDKDFIKQIARLKCAE